MVKRSQKDLNTIIGYYCYLQCKSIL